MRNLFNEAVRMFSGAEDTTDIAALPAQRKPRGMIDPAKLIEASDQLQKMIEKENVERAVRLQQLEASQAKLEAAVHNMFEQQKAVSIAHTERVRGIVTVIAEGVQGIVAAPKTARFKKTARFQPVAV